MTVVAVIAVLGGAGAVLAGGSQDALAGDLGRHLPFVGAPGAAEPSGPPGPAAGS